MDFLTRHELRVPRSRWAIYGMAIALPLGVTVGGAQIHLPAFVFEHVMIVFVVALAIAGGRGPAIVTAFAGGIGDNLLLRDPIGRPAITGIRDAVDLGLFLGVAVVVGWLVDRVRAAGVEALQAAERERVAREELDRLVATVTHDLATPLGAIQGTIQFARKHSAITEVDLTRLLMRVETAAARATSLVRVLTDAKSIERRSLSLDLQPVDLRTIVEPIVKMLDRTSDRHPIAVAMPPEPLMVDGDAERLVRVVENLVSNAIKYSPAGGTIEVSLSQERRSVALMVRDHGIGVPAESRDKLFVLGYRAPEAARIAPGLGLGLFTAAEVIRRHGGTIGVEEADGGGTVFTVRLPLVAHAVGIGADAMVDRIGTGSSSGAIH